MIITLFLLCFVCPRAGEGIPAAYCRCKACMGVRERGGIEIKTRSALRIGSKYQIGELRVETVKGNHGGFGENERAMHYLLELPGNKRLLYALDTGYYLQETWEYLERRRADILIMDCTFGGRTDRGEFPDGHLDIASFLKTVERMTEIGFIDGKSRLYGTHINPHQGLTHHEMQRRFDESRFKVTVAYDGLKVKV